MRYYSSFNTYRKRTIKLKTRFTLYIDESGEAGIGKIRTAKSGGASPYMTLGAVLIPNESRKRAVETLDKLKGEIGKKRLHCAELKHYQLIHFARTVAARKLRFFGVISRKGTLGKYKTEIADDSTMYYNKCAQYLLERVGWFMETRKVPRDNVDIVFEKANIDYSKMRNLIRTCQRNPRHKNTKRLQNIDADRIVVRKKSEEPLLQIADLVAHSLYKCVDKSNKNYGIPEPRYVRELASRFFGDPDSAKVVGAGLYCVHSTKTLNLDKDVEETLMNLCAEGF